MIALVALAAWYFTGRALRPVEAIRLEAESITGATIDRRVPEPDTDDEVGRLARTMNAMLDRLESSSQRQRQFVSDASHELRSPLASIRTNLEVALRNADRADWPAVAERALAEDERMEDTVSELLELARLDEAAGPRAARHRSPRSTSTSSCSTTPCSNAGYPSTPPACRPAGCTAAASSSRASCATCSTTRPATRATTVAVELRHRRRPTVELTVDDDGPGIPADDRERVFERFTRLDDGRARDAGGLGLGLSMVKAITEQHGGTVDDRATRRSAGPGSRVRLPAA